MSQPTTEPLDQFDLLPTSFRNQDRVRQALCGWITIVLTLVAILFGTAVATLLRSHRNARFNAQLASTASPLLDLRDDVIRLRELNGKRGQLCDLVETARPHDDALQTLAAIAVATQKGPPDILIDSIHLRLPIEYPPIETEPPVWARPELEIEARSANRDAVGGWLDRLNRFDRISNATVNLPVSQQPGPQVSPLAVYHETASVTLTAQPEASGVLP